MPQQFITLPHTLLTMELITPQLLFTPPQLPRSPPMLHTVSFHCFKLMMFFTSPSHHFSSRLCCTFDPRLRTQLCCPSFPRLRSWRILPLKCSFTTQTPYRLDITSAIYQPLLVVTSHFIATDYQQISPYANHVITVFI